jgi:hypothetical protein
MKSIYLSLAVLLCGGAISCTQNNQSSAQAGSGKPVNMMCAIMDTHPVDPKGATVVHNGKVIGFCCADCIPEFKKDPDKYVASLK